MSKTEESTHGCGFEFEDDGVPRRYTIFKSDAGRYMLDLTTWWDGYDSPPTETRVIFSPVAFGVLFDAMAEIIANPEKYRQSASTANGEGA